MKKLINEIKKNRVTIFEIIVILLISLFCYSISPKTLQNDTYYNISIGNYIMKNGIDMQDHYSWHEDLPYTYPHWLFDVITAFVYNLGGWYGIYIFVCIMCIILGISIYFVNENLTKSKIISFLITIGVLYVLQPYIAARAQLITFIIYMFVIFCIEKFLKNPKKIGYSISIIISSILIANLHVAVWPFLFILFLPFIGEWIISLLVDFLIFKKYKILYFKLKLNFYKYKNNLKKIDLTNLKLQNIYNKNILIKQKRESTEPYKIKLQKNKNVKWLILLMLICAFTGLLTPTKFTPYTYLYKTLIGSTTKNINEHLPLTLIYDTPVLCILVILISLVTFTKIKITLSHLFMIAGLIYLMFSSKRQTTMLVLIGSFILNNMIIDAIKLYTSYEIKKLESKAMNIIGISILAILVILMSTHFQKQKRNNPIVDEKTYPVKASDWILKNLDINNIKLFNEYNYGSYLLFRGIPVFIDSRADLYAPEFNKKTDDDGKDIFMDFMNVSSINKYYGSIFEKYGITHVLLYKNSKISMLINKADSDKYNKIYTDKNFVIYEILKN